MENDVKFDLAFGVNSGALQNTLAALYGNTPAREKYFKGSISVSTPKASVGYDFSAVPVVSLTPPSSDEWKDAYNSGGTQNGNETPYPSGILFSICVPQLNLTVKTDGGQPSSELIKNLYLYAEFSVTGDEATSKYSIGIVPRALYEEKATITDLTKVFLNYALDKIFAALTDLAGNIPLDLSNMNVGGVKKSFKTPILDLRNGVLSAVLYSAEKPAPDYEKFPALAAGQNVFVLCADGVLFEIIKSNVNDALADYIAKNSPKTFGDNGSAASATLTWNISLDTIAADKDDPLKLNAAIKVNTFDIDGEALGGVCGVSTATDKL